MKIMENVWYIVNKCYEWSKEDRILRPNNTEAKKIGFVYFNENCQVNEDRLEEEYFG